MNDKNGWTKERPTKPGWWWYEDPYYGPSPMHIDLDVPSGLVVESAVSVDEDIEGTPVGSLDGYWHPLDEPERQHNEWDEALLS